MPTEILASKLFAPPARSDLVLRSRLIERLDAGLERTLTLVSAPAGFGKSTLVGAWLADRGLDAAWLSLDASDDDPIRLLTYLIAALQTVAPGIGEAHMRALQSPQPPPPESLLTSLLNELASVPERVVLVLDDMHAVESAQVDRMLAFLVEQLPPSMHVLIATREDPPLPLARLRARGQVTEIRAADLRFTREEAAEFLQGAAGADLAAGDVALLADRTEGWIAGLQLAALSLRGHENRSAFVASFSGSHRFVLDYLVEEVLQQQPESVQAFLLRTSILDRLCGPLCDAVMDGASGAGQRTLEAIESANLFVVPLDDERRWYRYHHLFADLLRQRLHQSAGTPSDGGTDVDALHRRASRWYEDNGLRVDAFHHAAAAHDAARAERLVEGEGMPMHFRGAAAPVLRWLEGLAPSELDARPSLWVLYASALLFTGKNVAAVEKLEMAESAMRGREPDAASRDLLGRIASLRATLIVPQNDADAILTASRRALEYLDADNLASRTAATWTLGFGYHLQGDREAARRAFSEVVALGRTVGESLYTMAATLTLGQLQEVDTKLASAARSYERVVEMAGDPPQLMACEAHLGLARVAYERNELEAALGHAQRCGELTRQIESVDTFASCGMLLARLRLARGDVPGAAAVLDEAEAFVREHGFAARLPDVAAVRVVTLLHQGHVEAAARLAEAHELPMSRARVRLAQGDPSAALGMLEPWREHAEASGWADVRLRAMALQAVALHAHGDEAAAVETLSDALALAEPEGLVRVFADEGPPMERLVHQAAKLGRMPSYTARLTAAFTSRPQPRVGERPSGTATVPGFAPSDPLSERELEVLRLVAQGLSNQEIADRLFRALDTVKGHTRRIYGKLDVRNRTEAVARARELGLV